MNKELEKDFLEEIKPLIDEYLKSTRELKNLEIEGRSIVKEIGEQRSQEIRQVIYNKTKRFMDKAKEQSMEDKKKEIEKKAIELKVAKDNLKSKYVYSKNTIQLRNRAKAISNVAYKSADDMLQIAVNELRQANETYKKVQEEYTKAQELETIELLDEKYRNIDFENERGIEDIINIIKEQQEKDLSNESKEREQTIHNPRMRETSDDTKIASLEELEKGRTQAEENEMEQDEYQKVKTVFPRIHVDEADIETRPKVLTRADLENEKKQGDSSLNEENEVDEQKRKLEEEQMWEEYNKEQEEKRKLEEEQMWEEYNKEQEEKREKHDKSEQRFYESLEKEKKEFNEEEEKRQEKEQQIRQKKEQFFNNKEKGYEDLLKDDLSYQALKERLINTYTLSQLRKALDKKSLVEIYDLYVKQVIKDIEDTEIIEKGLTEEELEAKLQEKLANEELKTTLSVRLELLKDRQKGIKERQEQERKAIEQYNKREAQATKFFENIEKKYGEDLLPKVYLKDKTDLIDKYAKGENTELLSDFKFLEYCEEQLKLLEVLINDPIIKEGVEVGETLEKIDDYNDLQDKIKYIREKAIELGEIPPYIQEIKEKLENLYTRREEGYRDLLPNLYYDYKKYEIKEYMCECMKDSALANDFLENYEEMYETANINNVLSLCKSVDDYFTVLGNYPKENGELATDEEIYELRNAIQQIEKRKYIKENAYKETKIVVEPYNDRIMIYLKGEVEPREHKNLAQLMEDGKNLYKSGSNNDGRNLNGLVRGIEKGNYAIIAVLSQLGIEKKEDYIEGYTHMFAKNPEVTSEIDSIVYDFSKEDGKIQSQKMIKEMQKCAKDAEKYGVAESIGRKKGIIEKGKEGIGNLFGKGKEKVLALGEGIRDFHPIENAIENRRAKKYSKDKKIDGSKATSTYNEWEDNQNKAYNDLIARIRQNVPTEEEQEAFIEKLKNEQVFNDRSEQEKVHNVKEDEFYDMYGG